MSGRHVTHLLARHVHGQLSPARRAQVINHVRVCAACRAALAREERLAADVRREMPQFGQPRPAQLAHVWASVWDELGPQAGGRSRRSTVRERVHGWPWLPGLSMILAALLLLAVALPLIAQSDIRVEAAPLQPRPVSTASPTPGATDTVDAFARSSVAAYPAATVAYAPGGASPVPMPGTTQEPGRTRSQDG
jgi:hypothetical protein